jgi:large subunit ribosomal protein L29
MKAEKIRSMDATELQREANDAQEQLFRLRFQMGMGQTEGLKKYRGLRKDRARLLTALSAKRNAGETIPALAPPPKKAVAVKKVAKKK